jgi:hypothetical protein
MAPLMMMMMMMRRLRSMALLGALGGLTGLSGCVNPTQIPGTCERNSAVSCGASAVLAGDKDSGVTDEELALVGYSCSGGQLRDGKMQQLRPDDDGKMIQGIPYGQICADMTPPPDPDGGVPPETKDYCCTSETDLSNCVYNRNRDEDCPEGYAYQCHGPNRPEVNNPAVTCGNGLREGEYIHYCCQHAPRPPGCVQAKGATTCMGGLIGWVCPTTPVEFRPRGEDFGANESRADYYYFVCGVPTLAPNKRDNVYCCYSPSPVLPGGSCTYSPGSANKPGTGLPCAPGRFAFACYGRDRPDQDFYPRIKCTEPSVQGMSDTGYAASLYCCDYVAPGMGSGAGTDPEE